ncbi:hypothetical protein [Corynebacterium cystitidis]|uniref:hypothetical protein n=1 Tax=Corynebacterium cystitidis TaxID=35757 RepID=UPI00211F3744|nr:hypothetical protein [Corynebacterium cystitidis]
MAVDWDSHKAGREAAARDEGQWLGLFGNRMDPLMDFPPVVEVDAQWSRNTPVSFRALAPVRSLSGDVHPIVDELVADGLSKVDEQGRLVAVMNRSRFAVVERPGVQRRCYRVTHVVASGSWEAPEMIEVHGTCALSELLRHVAWSAPTTITGRFVRFERDWVGPEEVAATFEKPRDLQDMKMVTVADGVTLDGPADEVLRRLIKRSLEASWVASGITGVVDDPPIVVDPTGSRLASPYVLVRPNDEKLLDAVLPVAAAAGVNIKVGLWLPGDRPVPGLDLKGPKLVVRVEQSADVKEV